MKHLTKTQKILYIAAGVCLALSLVFEICFIGYLMSALVCLGCAVCFVLFALLAGQDTKKARRLRLALIACLIIGCVCFLIAEVPILMDVRSDEDTFAPYLIVCGAGLNGAKPSRSLTDRLERALEWLEENPDSIAILSGSQGPNEEVSEASAMYNWLLDNGVDADRLIVEDAANNSFENIKYSLAIIESLGGDPGERIAIVSSEYHLHRLRCIAENLGCEAVLVAARTTRPARFVNNAIREAFAMWKLWVFGM